MGTKSLQHSRIVPISRLLLATIGKWSGHAKEGNSYCFRCQWIGTTPCSPIHSICRQKLGAYLTRFLSDAVPSHSHHQRAVGSQNGCLTHLAVAVGENKKSRKFTTFIHLINNWKFLTNFRYFSTVGASVHYTTRLHRTYCRMNMVDRKDRCKKCCFSKLFLKITKTSLICFNNILSDASVFRR